MGTWYMPSNSSIELFDFFETILDKIENENIECTFLGDFNCNNSSQYPSQCTNALLELCDLYQFSLLIKKPTRVTKNSATTIDLILTNEPHKYNDVGVSNIGISDHNVIYASRKFVIPKTTPKYVKYRSFKHFNYDNFLNDINQVPWDNFLMIGNPIVAWEKWHDLFMQIADRHSPMKTKRIRNSFSPWLSPVLKQHMYQCDHLKKVATITGNEAVWTAYKQARNNVNSEIKSCKASYYNNFFSNNKGNTRETWRGINTILAKNSKNTSVPATLDGIDYNNSTTGPNDISNLFNDYFVEIGPNLAEKIQQSALNFSSFIKPAETTFELTDFKNSEIAKIIQTLPTKKASGLDGIPACLVKASVSVISESLTHIFNLSINQGVLPDDWKNARVTPVYKEGVKSTASTYRPISVLPVVAKILERAVFNHFYAYLVKLITIC